MLGNTMKKQVQVKIERHAKPYCFMWDAVIRYGDAADKAETGWYWDCFAALTFAAFTVEGYLNHLGDAVYRDWRDLERLDPIAKLRFLSSLLKLDCNVGKRPLQSVHQLFRFRNKIAHPKSEKIVVEGPMDADSYQQTFYDQPKTDWEDFVTKEKLKQVREDVFRTLHQLHNAAGLVMEGDLLFSEGGVSGLATLIETEAEAQ